MRVPFWLKKFKYYLMGIGTYLPKRVASLLPHHQHQFFPSSNSVRVGNDAFEKAKDNYALWLRALVHMETRGIDVEKLKNIAELGPGDSLGIGIMSLLTGGEKYIALDQTVMAFSTSNNGILNVLEDLLRNQKDIPDDEDRTKMFPRFASYEYPEKLLARRMSTMQFADSIQELRSVIARTVTGNSSTHSDRIQYGLFKDWKDIFEAGTLDLVFSNAVMEHVDDVRPTYESAWKWLRSGGFMYHVIDFKSHGTGPDWNGHWTFSDRQWRIVRGHSRYLINRMACSTHIQEMEQAGFKIVSCERYSRKNVLQRKDLADAFKGMSEEDLQTAVAVIVAQKATHD